MKGNHRPRSVLPLSILIAVAILSVNMRFTVSAAPATYAQDATGLEKQFEPLVKAWGKHDMKAIDEACKSLALPDPSGWFSNYFAKDQVQQLVWDDEAEVNNFKTVTPGMMNILAKGQKFRVRISLPDLSSSTKVQPRADAVVPLTPVPIEQFTVAFVAEKGASMSMLLNFVYVDGAHRYVGRGAYPFWSMPDVSRK